MINQALTKEMIEKAIKDLKERSELARQDFLVHCGYFKSKGLNIIGHSLACPCQSCLSYREFARSYLGPTLFEHWKPKMFVDAEAQDETQK
jgi:hypothetical protein